MTKPLTYSTVSQFMVLLRNARQNAELALADPATPVTLRGIHAANEFITLRKGISQVLGIAPSADPPLYNLVEQLATHYRQVDNRDAHDAAGADLAVKIEAYLRHT